MTPANLKQKILKTVEEMPQDVSFEEVMERLYFLYKIERGLQQVETDNILSHQQAKQNLKKWHE
jgi:hypothetical protein